MMRNCRPHSIINLLFILVLLFSVPACGKGGQQDSLVSEVVLTSGVDSQSKPVDASNVFTVMAEVIYLSLKVTDAPNNTAVMARLTYLSGEVSSMANSTLYSSTQNTRGTTYLSFAMKPPPGGFPAGSYQVAISANGKEQASVPFSVENLRAQKAQPVIKKFTVDRNTITAGKTVTLSWEVSDATRVTLQPEIGSVDVSGTRSVTPTATATYTLVASNDTGSTKGELIVNVGKALIGDPDLVITELWLEGCMVYYKVKNTGTRDSIPTYTYLYVDDMYPPLGGSSFVAALKPGEERSMQFSSFQWPWCGTSETAGPGGGGAVTVKQALINDFVAKCEKLDSLTAAIGKMNEADRHAQWEETAKQRVQVFDQIYGTDYATVWGLNTRTRGEAADKKFSESVVKMWEFRDALKNLPQDQGSQDAESGGSSWTDYYMTNHTIRACADAKNELEEGDKNNNCTSKNWGILMKYDLLPLAHMAVWLNNSGLAPFFGSEDGAEGGYIKLGDGSLEVIPLKVPGGFTQGYFGYFSTGTRSLGDVNTGPIPVPSAPIKIPPKTKFFARVGLASNAVGSDGVTFKFGLKSSSGDTFFLPVKKMTEPGKFEDWVIDLSDYQGQVVRFVLCVEAGASPDNDFAVWKEARLEQME